MNRTRVMGLPRQPLATRMIRPAASAGPASRAVGDAKLSLIDHRSKLEVGESTPDKFCIESCIAVDGHGSLHGLVARLDDRDLPATVGQAVNLVRPIGSGPAFLPSCPSSLRR